MVLCEIKHSFIMKTSIPRKVCAIFATVSIWSAPAGLWAADGSWSLEGNGDWNDPDNWAAGVASGAGFTATFDATPFSPQTGKVVTLTEDLTIGNITAKIGATGTWNIQGSGVLTLSSGGTDQPVINVSGGTDPLRITAVIAGTNGFVKAGGNRLYLSGANTFTGGVTIDLGTIWTANAATLNGNTLTFNGGAWLVAGNNSNYGNNVILNSNVSFSGSGNDDIILSGSISETGGVRTLGLSTNGGHIRFTLRGDNAYTGDTNIGLSNNNVGSTIIRAEHNNAFGTGTANISFRGGINKTESDDSVELAGNITISNKTLTLRGMGNGDAGSLRSVSGINTWNGDINTGDFGNARIGVDADQLIVEGEISGTGANGLTKVGDGVLVLNGVNTFTNGMVVQAGELQAGHNSALANGSLTLGDGTGIDVLRVKGGVNLGLSSLALTDSSEFSFDLTGVYGATGITVAGDQTGTGTYGVNIFDGGGLTEGIYTLMTVNGTFGATDFVLNTLPTGYADSFLEWNNGVLTLNVIPEPSSLLLLGFSSILVFSRKRSGVL